MTNKFFWEEGNVEISLCGICKHKHTSTKTCDAYPTEIPVKYLSAESDHLEPTTENEIVFEAADNVIVPARVEEEKE